MNPDLSSSKRSRLAYQHQTIEELINGFSEEHLQLHPVANKWSAFENIVHLTVYQHVFQERVNKILRGNNPSFARYIADSDPLFESSRQQSLVLIMKDLHTVRQQLYQQISGLSMNQLSHTGHHPKYGLLSLVQWIEFFLLHEAHHLLTLFNLINERATGSSN